MAKRRRRQQGSSVSLFPFLSVLACVIGTLTLLLAALALGQVGSRSLTHARLVQRHRATQAFVADARAELAQIERRIARAEKQGGEAQRLEARIRELGLPPDLPIAQLQEIVGLRQQLAELRGRSQKLERERQRLRAAVAAAENELSEREGQFNGLPIVIDPSGFARSQRPYFVECAKNHLELHRSSGDWSYRIPREDISRSQDFKTFLRRVRAIHNGLVVFLIRPDGVPSFDLAAAAARQQGTRQARLPLPGAGRLDFSLLNRAQERGERDAR